MFQVTSVQIVCSKTGVGLTLRRSINDDEDKIDAVRMDGRWLLSVDVSQMQYRSGRGIDPQVHRFRQSVVDRIVREIDPSATNLDIINRSMSLLMGE